MSARGEVLIAIMNDLLDMDIARNQHWYRIPVHSVKKLLKERWPPQWLAFYQTKDFGDEAHAVNYYARLEKYCVPTVVENIKRLGGLEEGGVMPRKIDLDTPGGWQQPSLFDPANQNDPD